MLAFIATDIDEEIDDQCALEYLFRHMKQQKGEDAGGQLVILLVGGKPVPDAEARALSEHRLHVFWEYYPQYAGIRGVQGGSLGCEYDHDGSVFQDRGLCWNGH